MVTSGTSKAMPTTRASSAGSSRESPPFGAVTDGTLTAAVTTTIARVATQHRREHPATVHLEQLGADERAHAVASTRRLDTRLDITGRCRLGEAEERRFQPGRRGEAVEDDPVRGGELADLFGRGVDLELVVDSATAVPGGAECGTQPLRLRGADTTADAGLGAQGGQGRGPYETAARDQQHVVGGQLDLAQCVAGDQHGAALVGETAHVLAQPPDALRVETVRRFVQHEDCRVAEHRRGQPEALTHPEGELADPAPRIRRQAGLLEHAQGRLVAQLRRRRQRAEVVERGAPGVEAGGLEHGTDVTNGVRKLVIPPAVAERRRPAGRDDEPEQHAQRRRLSGTVGPEERRHLSCCDRCADVVDGAHVAEELGDAAQLDRRLGHTRAGSSSGSPSAAGAAGTGSVYSATAMASRQSP